MEIYKKITALEYPLDVNIILRKKIYKEIFIITR